MNKSLQIREANNVSRQEESMAMTFEKVAIDDFYENRGQSCFCCPNGISRQNVECMKWRRENLGNKGRVHTSMAGRYPVDKKFPCEACGKIDEHRH